MISHNLKSWKIFNILESEFIQKIHVAAVYGDSGDNAIIATYDDMVYALGTDVNKYSDNLSAIGIFSPKKIDKLCGKNIKTFVCGKDYILALTNDGLVYSYGYIKSNDYAFNSTYRSISSLVKSHLNDTFILDIACGPYHFLALTNKGKVREWNNKLNTVFTEVNDALANEIITCISCGNDFNIVVTNKGEVYGWGKNTVGQLGVKSYADIDGPRKIKSLRGIAIEKVVCGYSHTLALSTMGVLYVWGENSCGQLGLNTTANTCVPVKLETKEMGKVWDVAASSASHISVAIVENNRVFIWGQCIGQNILVPTCTLLKCLHDAFAYYAWPRVTYQSLIFYDGRNSDLITSLGKAFDNPETSDFIIKVQGKSIYVHRIVLKIRCRYYRTMFQKFWAENSQSVIQEDQFSYNVFKSFLNYLYTDNIDLSSDSEIVELLSLANMYFMDQLSNCCSQMLINRITLKNIVYLYNISIKYNVKELKKYCFRFAINHMTAVVQIQDFIELDKDIIKDFLIEAAKAGVFKT